MIVELCVIGVLLRKIEGRPRLERRSVPALPAEDVFLVGSAVIEQIEADEFHTLHLQIDQRAANAANRGRKRPGAGNYAVGFRIRVCRAPISPPIDPGESSRLDGALTAAAERLVIFYFSLKTVRAIFRVREAGDAPPFPRRPSEILCPLFAALHRRRPETERDSAGALELAAIRAERSSKDGHIFLL